MASELDLKSAGAAESNAAVCNDAREMTVEQLLRDYGLPTMLLLGLLWMTGKAAVTVWRDLVLPMRDKCFVFIDGILGTMAGLQLAQVAIRESCERQALDLARHGEDLRTLSGMLTDHLTGEAASGRDVLPFHRGGWPARDFADAVKPVSTTPKDSSHPPPDKGA